MFQIGVNFSTVHSNSGNSREGLLCMVRGPTPSLFSDMSDLRVIVVHCVGRGRSFGEYLVHSPLLFIKGNWDAERGHVICPRSCSAYGNVDGVVAMSCASSSVALAAPECPPCLQERQIWAPVTTYSLRNPNWPLGGKVATLERSVAHPHRDRYRLWVCVYFSCLQNLSQHRYAGTHRKLDQQMRIWLGIWLYGKGRVGVGSGS